MTTMRPSPRVSRSTAPVLLLALLVTVTCSQPARVPVEDAANDSRASLRDSNPPDNDNGDNSAPASFASPANEAHALPFHESGDIPAGTMVNVRLVAPIAAVVPVANDSFGAVVEQSVVVAGTTIIPRGASVAGRVEAVLISQTQPRRGYVRLVLESVRLGGTDVPLQTTSLFARQMSANDPPSSTIHLEKGRRLTFRLTEPVILSRVPLKPPAEVDRLSFPQKDFPF